MSDAAGLAGRLVAGDRRTLSQLITLAESKLAPDRARAAEVLRAARFLGPAPAALRLAFTGPPGVGKSSLIERLGAHVMTDTQRPAVLAFDPSSPKSGGSLLGDRTRMAALSSRENAFIRPSPQRGSSGGLGAFAPLSIELCEYAGYDPVIVETVGVGQGEVDVRDVVDCVVLVLGPDGGDELQGMKRGINEICDFLVINKSDVAEDRARQLELAYRAAFDVTRALPDGGTEIYLTSALDGSGVAPLWTAIEAFHQRALRAGTLQKQRAHQRLRQLQRALALRFEQSLGEPARSEAIARAERRVALGELSIDEASEVLFHELCPAR
jgi:LAO/AO transport system kinase